MTPYSDSARTPFGIASILIPPALVVLLIAGQGLNPQSVAGRLLNVVALFGLGVGVGLGLSGLKRIGNRTPRRFSAIVGLMLNGLLFLGFALSAAMSPAPAPPAAAQSPVTDNRASDR